MAFHRLEYRLQYIREHVPTPISARLSQAFAEFVAPYKEQTQMASQIWNALELDLIYSLARHRSWLHVPIFKDVVADYLASEYRLQHDVAAELASCMSDVAASCSARRHPPFDLSDEEFVKYIFVTSAAAKNESQLITDLGLGSSILAKIHNVIGQEDCGAPSECFVPELEGIIRSTMLTISEDLKATPWSMDILRLKYMLLTIRDPWAACLRSHGPHWLFHILVRLGATGSAKTKTIATWLGNNMPGQEVGGSLAHAEHLMESLHALDLVHPLAIRKKPGGMGHSSWALLPRAEELTAEAFMHLHGPKRPLTMECIARHNGAYQAAMINGLSEEDQDLLTEFLERPPKGLSPIGFMAVTHRLAQLASPDEVCHLLVRILVRDTPSWLKRAACDRLIHFSPGRDVGQTLSKLAQFDQSPGVREAAMQCLIALEAHDEFHAIFRQTQADGMLNW